MRAREIGRAPPEAGTMLEQNQKIRNPKNSQTTRKPNPDPLNPNINGWVECNELCYLPPPSENNFAIAQTVDCIASVPEAYDSVPRATM